MQPDQTFMAKPTKKRDEAPAMVALSPFVLKAGAAVLVLLLAGLGLWRIEKTNRRIQAERRVLEDPELSVWLSRLKSEVGQFQARPASSQGERSGLAEGVWLGTISQREHNSPSNRRPELISVALRPAWLLAGSRSPKDASGDEVRIGVKDFKFLGGPPQVSERWLFAVERINGGHNVVQDARAIP